MERRLAIESTKALVNAAIKPIVFSVQGGSMWPTFHDGDEVTVEAVERYQIGDILLFDNGVRLITHRLVDIAPPHYWTKGDNVRRRDLPIEKEAIVGRVHLIKRGENQIPLSSRRQRRWRFVFQYAWVLSALRRRLS